LSYVAAVDCEGRTIWIGDAHRDGQRFVVRADEILTAFLELERATRGLPRFENALLTKLSEFRPDSIFQSKGGSLLFLQQKRNHGTECGDRDDTIRRKRPTPKRGLGLNQDQHDTEYNDADFPLH
jgi:hypothetical protein